MRLRALGSLGALAIAIHIAAGVSAQEPVNPTFDVASIKQNKSGESNARFGGPPTGFMATNTPLLQLIIFAYQVQGFQIERGPSWLTIDRFDISAKAEGTFPPAPAPGGPPSTTQLMMRALLADRFKLVVHRETKDRPIYALVLAKTDKAPGPQLRRSDVDCAALVAAVRRGAASPPPPPSATNPAVCGSANFFGRIVGGTVPLAQLVAILSQTLQRVVVDRTGLTGTFDFTLTYAPDQPARGTGGPEPPPVDSNAPSLVTALQEQLGLKLESRTGPVDVLAIDSVEHPTPD